MLSLPSLLTGRTSSSGSGGDSSSNEINHSHYNGSANTFKREVNTIAAAPDEPIIQAVSQSQYYFYQQRLFSKPTVNLRISSEYGIIRQRKPSSKDDEYYVYTNVGTSSSPNGNSIVVADAQDKDRDKDKDGSSNSVKVRFVEKEKVIEPQQSTLLESPAYTQSIGQYYSTAVVDAATATANDNNQQHQHQQLPHQQSQPSGSLQSIHSEQQQQQQVSYNDDDGDDVDPTASSSLLDTSNVNSLSTYVNDDGSEKSNTIVENQPSSISRINNSNDSDNIDNNDDGGGGRGGEDDYSNYYHYTDDDDDDDYQQYSASFPDYTDDELLENEANQPEIHNQYFVKTKPRDVITQIETSVPPPPPLTEQHGGGGGYVYKEDPFGQALVHLGKHWVVNETVNTNTITPTPAKTPVTATAMQDSLDFYENMSNTINRANNHNPHSMKYEIPPPKPNPPTMATTTTTTTTTTTSYDDESTKMQDEPMYGLMMTPTIASNLIADVTKKFGSTDSTSIPGMPGIDYPILDEVPHTGFDCQKQRYKGFFADVETKCQAWHYCDFIDGHSTFLCPNGTLFSQTLLTCDWWFNVKCEESLQLYVLNERLYRYIKAPKLSFPEDFHGPHVDDWLLEQLQLGLLPKIKKKVKDKVVIQAHYS